MKFNKKVVGAVAGVFGLLALLGSCGQERQPTTKQPAKTEITEKPSIEATAKDHFLYNGGFHEASGTEIDYYADLIAKESSKEVRVVLAHRAIRCDIRAQQMNQDDKSFVKFNALMLAASYPDRESYGSHYLMGKHLSESQPQQLGQALLTYAASFCSNEARQAGMMDFTSPELDPLVSTQTADHAEDAATYAHNEAIANGKRTIDVNLNAIVVHGEGINCRAEPEGEVKEKIAYGVRFHVDASGLTGKYDGWNHVSERGCWIKVTKSIRYL